MNFYGALILGSGFILGVPLFLLIKLNKSSEVNKNSIYSEEM